MNKKTPFKFLDSYTQSDRDIFFGRESEIEEVYSRLFYSKLLLVYGPSGSGKTSLLQCGVANRFGEHNWKPIFIRRKQNIVQSIHSELGKQAITKLEEKKSITQKLYSLYLDYLTPVYLIFDQFEELFIFGNADEKKEFVAVLKDILSHEDLNTQIILSIREEYLASLSEFEDELPQLFENRIRIEKMKKAQALSVIVSPCEVCNVGLENGLPEMALEKIISESATIELTWMQVLMDRLYKSALERNKEKVEIKLSDLEALGKIGDVLGSFLEEQLKLMPEGEKGEAILKTLVSTDGTKRQLTLSEIKDALETIGHKIEIEKIQQIVQHFITVRILSDKDENDRYELKHDSLAAKIYERLTLVEKELLEVRQFIEYAYQSYQSRGKYLSEDDLKYIGPYERKIIFQDDLSEFLSISKKELEKINRKKKRVFRISFAIIFIVLFSFSYWTGRQNKISRSNELAAFALTKMETDPTLAYLLGEKAYKTYKGYLAKKVLFESFNKKNFYNTIPGSDFQIPPTDDYLITFTSDTTIAIWDTNLKLVKDKIPHQNKNGYSGILKTKITKDGKYIVTAKDFIIYVWNTTGQLIEKFEFDINEFNLKNDEEEFTYSIFDDRYVVIYLYDNSNLCYILDLITKDRKKILAGDSISEKIWRVRVSPNRNYFLIATHNELSPAIDNLYLYDNNGNLINKTSINENDDPYFIDDNSYFLKGIRDSFKIFNLNGQPIKQLNLGNGYYYVIDFSKDLTKLILGKGDTAYLIDVSNFQTKLLSQKGLSGGALFSNFSTHFALLEYGSENTTICNADGKVVGEVEGGFISFSQDDKYILSEKNNELIISDLNCSRIKSLKIPISNSFQTSFFSLNKYLISCEDGGKNCIVWSVPLNDPFVIKENKKNDRVTSVTFSSSFSMINNEILKFSSDGNYLISNFNTGNSLYVINNSEDIVELYDSKGFYDAFFINSDNNIITINIKNEAKLWNIKGEEIFDFVLYGPIENSVNSFIYLSQNKLIISNSKTDSTNIIIYDLSGKIIKKLLNHKSPIRSLKSDNEYLFSLSQDGTIYIWDLKDILYTVGPTDSLVFDGSKPNFIEFSSINKNILLTFNDSSLYYGNRKKIDPKNILKKSDDAYNKFEIIDDEFLLCQDFKLASIIVFLPSGKLDTITSNYILNSKIMRHDGKEFKPIQNVNDVISLYKDRTYNQVILSYLNYQSDKMTSILDKDMKVLFTIPSSTISYSKTKKIIASYEDEQINLYPSNVEKIMELIRKEKIYGQIRDFTDEEKKEFRIR